MLISMPSPRNFLEGQIFQKLNVLYYQADLKESNHQLFTGNFAAYKRRTPWWFIWIYTGGLLGLFSYILVA